MHALEKILSRAAKLKEVKAGDYVLAQVDLAEVNDLYLQVITSFRELGGKKVHDPKKIAFVLDHYAPAPTIKAAANQKQMRDFCWEQGILHLFDVGKGVCHQIMPEAGLVYPGMVLVATDSHTTTHGAFGCFGTGVGATDLAFILLTGKIWFRVPAVMNIKIHGEAPQGVMAKDIILSIIGELGQDGAVYQAVEFTGEAVEKMSLAERMVLCNMTTEMGAKTSYIQPDEKVFSYLSSRAKEHTVYETDPWYVYSAAHTFEVDHLEPVVALPHSVDWIAPIADVGEISIHQSFIGTCTGGRFEDLEIAAQILKGHRVHPKVRLLIIPASDKVYLQAIESGLISQLMRSGATISTPGCGPCLGAHQGVLAEGEVGVTASSRNFPGRMGSAQSSLYLASPATCAASAIEGRLADPREYL